MTRYFTISALTAILVASSLLQAQTVRYNISHVAGSDMVRDGAPASNASFEYVRSIAFDRNGRLFIADSFANRIRVVTTDNTFGFPPRDYANGRISTFAGNGIPASSGDGGPAVEAEVSSPGKMAVDLEGNLYFCESGRVRMVDTTGMIRTIAGGGAQREITESVDATSVSLGSLTALTVDRNRDIYFTEANLGLVRKISAEGKLTTVAGGGQLDLEADGGPAIKARLLWPNALAVDSAGNLYVMEMDRSCIRKISADRTIRTIAGTGVSGSSGDGGPAVNAQLNRPRDLALDSGGNLYVLDNSGMNLRMISADGVIQTKSQLYGGYSGGATSLAVGPEDQPWLSYSGQVGSLIESRYYGSIGSGYT
ncbi:MAG: hypothetical protein HY820_16730 [Acidobacteria bacterium]|nr:hypothetical protein [Acidobacteriota bacterium]